MSRFSSLRPLASAVLLSATLLAVSVVQVLAGGGNGPFPR